VICYTKGRCDLAVKPHFGATLAHPCLEGPLADVEFDEVKSLHTAGTSSVPLFQPSPNRISRLAFSKEEL
jgi:hypothetical protein